MRSRRSDGKFVSAAGEIVEEPDRGDRKNGPGFLTLWVAVSALWIAATLLRIHRLWAPLEGWQSALDGPWIWISLILPPLMFAVILVGVHCIISSRVDRG
jgi:hypothetical protein